MASPLALLAATCSKIGSQEHQQLLGGGKAGQQIKLSNSLSAALLQQLQQQSDTTATVASQLSPMTPRDPLAASPSPPQHQQQPQLITGITLAQLQNLLPLQQQLQVSAANDITQQLQGQTVKTFTSSAAGLSNPTVVSVQGVPGQFIQVSKFRCLMIIIRFMPLEVYGAFHSLGPSYDKLTE